MSTVPATGLTAPQPEAATIPPASDAFPVELFPPALGSFIVGVAKKYSVDPAVVGAAVLVAGASALGPGVLVDTWSPTPVPAALNFVFVGKAGALLQTALDTVLFPFARIVQERRLAAQNVDPAVLAQTHRRKAMEIDRQAALGGTTILAPMKAECGQLLALLRPELLLESISVARLRGALAQSADLSLLLASVRVDAGNSWLRLKAAEREELGGVLSRSWAWQCSGFPEYPTPIHLPLLWRIGREHASRFVRCPELFGDSGVPFFFLELETARPAGPALAEPEVCGELWDQLLTPLLERRTSHDVTAYAFGPEAAAVLIAYINRVESESENLASDQRGCMSFWPEAARRLSLVFGILGATPIAAGIPRTAVDAAIGVIEWYGRASLRAVRLLLPTVMSAVRPVVRPDVRERMVRRIEERGPIGWRKLRRTFSDSTAALLTPVRDQLLSEGLIGWVEGAGEPELAIVDGSADDILGKDCHATASPGEEIAAAGLQPGTQP